MLLPQIAGLALATVVASATDPVDFQYSPQTDAQGKTTFTITFNEGSAGVNVVIKGDDGTTVKRNLGTVKKGKTVNITWKQKSQAVQYEMDLTGDTLNGNFTFNVIKAAAKGPAGKLKFKSSREDIVDKRKAKYQTSFALTSYEYTVIDDDGDTIASDVVAGDIPANGNFTISWDSPSNVFMIEVRGEDQYGRFVEDRRVPYSAEIPHTNVIFDSGKYNIKPGEVPKLDEAIAVAFHELDALDRVNKAVNANLTTQLYIVGYTDTVGNAAKNQKLSQNRAKSIAQYFYNEGFWAEIYYAGMGERGLAVETDDNVDEARNRRALYLIAFQKPGAGGSIPGRWTQLSGARSRPPGFQLPALPEKWADYRNKDNSHQSSANENSGGSSDAGSGSSDVGGSDSPDSGDDSGMPSDDGAASSVSDGPSDAGGPPPVEGDPGATSKGCTVGGDSSPMALGWLVLLGLGLVARRRTA
ncbi:MAG: OmpA family protein [Myxococcota bacterium]